MQLRGNEIPAQRQLEPLGHWATASSYYGLWHRKWVTSHLPCRLIIAAVPISSRTHLARVPSGTSSHCERKWTGVPPFERRDAATPTQLAKNGVLH